MIPRARLVAAGIAFDVVLATGAPRAEPARTMLVALAPGPAGRDAREALALGPHGEAYEPDGRGTWVRKHAGSLAGDVVRANRAGEVAIAGIDGGPPFAYRAGLPVRGEGDAVGAWNLVVLGWHAKAILGRGTRATAASGTLVFELAGARPRKLADAPAPVTMLAASDQAVVIETAKGLARLEAKGTATWKPIAGPPAHVLALLDDRWALVDRGLLELATRRVIPWPAGFHVAAAVAVDGGLVVAAGTHGDVPELLTSRGATWTREVIGSGGATPRGPGTAPIVAVIADKSGRAVVAWRDGQLAVRDQSGAWAIGEVRSELPADRPGSPPAVSSP